MIFQLFGMQSRITLIFPKIILLPPIEVLNLTGELLKFFPKFLGVDYFHKLVYTRPARQSRMARFNEAFTSLGFS